MKNILCFLFFASLFLCYAKEADNSNLSALRKIESSIQEKPEQAYNELVRFDNTNLSYGEERALYSLLLSVALDKNYIDICSDSLISPAVEYYTKSRDQYHKFLSYYYLGRVNENAEYFDKAIASYIEASKIQDKFIPNDYLIRLHTRKATVYFHQFALDKALDEYYEAKEKSTASDNPSFFIHCSLDVASTLASIGKQNEAYDELSSLKKWMTDKGLTPPKNFYHLWLRILLNNQSACRNEIELAFQNYYAFCKTQGIEINHFLAADYYLATNKPEKAKIELEKVDTASLNSFNYVQYYASVSKAEKLTHNYKEALKAHERYTERLSRINLDVHKNDVRFLEERSQSELAKANARFRTVILLILIILILSVAIGSITFLMIKKKQLNYELNNAKAEYGFLKEVANAGHDFPEEIQKTVNERIIALKTFIQAKRPIPIVEGRKLMEMNDKRKDMLSGIGLIYAATFPIFVSKLTKYGLTADEIGLCVMYLSGYSAKELNYYKNTYLAYQANTVIRQKIGLDPNSIKLTTWLKNLFEESL